MIGLVGWSGSPGRVEGLVTPCPSPETRGAIDPNHRPGW